MQELFELQDRVTELENRRPQVGPRGPAGPIDQALRNTAEAVPGFVSDSLDAVLSERIKELLPSLMHAALQSLQITELRGSTGDVGRDGPAGPAGRDGKRLLPTKEAVESIVRAVTRELLVDAQMLEESGNIGTALKYLIRDEIEKVMEKK